MNKVIISFGQFLSFADEFADRLDALAAVKDQLEMMGFPYPVCADFKVTITNRKGEPKFSVSMPTMRV